MRHQQENNNILCLEVSLRQSEKFLCKWRRAGLVADTVIFKVIKKTLAEWLSQVIHKIVIQNPVRNQEGSDWRNDCY